MESRSPETAAVVTAIIGGLVATASITTMTAMVNALGLLRFSFGRTLGTMVLPDGHATRVIGWVWHFLNGATFGVAYRQIFRLFGVPAAPMTGALLGLAHAIVSFLGMIVWPHVHPRPDQAGLRPFGPLVYGPITVPGMLMGHLVYGAIVGWFQRPRTCATQHPLFERHPFVGADRRPAHAARLAVAAPRF